MVWIFSGIAHFVASKFENFLGEDTSRHPYKAHAFGTCDNAPPLQENLLPPWSGLLETIKLYKIIPENSKISSVTCRNPL